MTNREREVARVRCRERFVNPTCMNDNQMGMKYCWIPRLHHNLCETFYLTQ